jgi:hypothetical protein
VLLIRIGNQLFDGGGSIGFIVVMVVIGRLRLGSISEGALSGALEMARESEV